ncbi:UNVERIFIED_CONTAM: hypothetical protein FKN15_030577 [Acipenser sinensis]
MMVMHALVKWESGVDKDSYSVIPTAWIRNFDLFSIADDDEETTRSFRAEWRDTNKPPKGGWPVYEAQIIMTEIPDILENLKKIVTKATFINDEAKRVSPSSGSDSPTPNCSDSDKEDQNRYNSLGLKYYKDKVEILPGTGVYIDKLSWILAERCRTNTSYVRTLMVAVFDIPTLLKSNLRGGGTKRDPTSEKKTPLDRLKVEAIYGSVLKKGHTTALKMLQQILKEMYIDPDVLEALNEEQKKILFLKMRQEQVRRWTEREENFEKERECLNSAKPKQASPKSVSWLLGNDGDVHVCVIGEAAGSKPYHLIHSQVDGKRETNNHNARAPVSETFQKTERQISTPQEDVIQLHFQLATWHKRRPQPPIWESWKQQQQQLPPQVEDPASLFPFCSWCGREDHRWRSCPDGPPADWCGRCEVDGHSWAGCPHNPDQEQLQTPSSAATPPLPTSPPSPPSQEIWDWLMHPEADLFHDLPIAINTLWRRDGGRWEKWEAQHHPASFAELALMVVNYLAVDMGEAPVKVELSSREPEREALLSQEPERGEPSSREPERAEKEEDTADPIPELKDSGLYYRPHLQHKEPPSLALRLSARDRQEEKGKNGLSILRASQGPA